VTIRSCRRAVSDPGLAPVSAPGPALRLAPGLALEPALRSALESAALESARCSTGQLTTMIRRGGWSPGVLRALTR
jgi:hypothetical protein